MELIIYRRSFSYLCLPSGSLALRGCRPPVIAAQARADTASSAVRVNLESVDSLDISELRPMTPQAFSADV